MVKEPKDKYSCLTEAERKEADQQRRCIEAILILIKACESLIGEVVQKSATDWGLVNDALVAGKWCISKARKGD